MTHEYFHSIKPASSAAVIIFLPLCVPAADTVPICTKSSAFLKGVGMCVVLSVTRLGNLLHFGQLFKACDIFRQFLSSSQNLSFC